MGAQKGVFDVLLGLQWGDEGKGKAVDALTPNYSMVARFQGGPNAGHSLQFEGKQFVLHTVPSGIFRPGIQNVIGNGVVIDPTILRHEIEAIEGVGVNVREQLMLSRKAHLILPSHRALDAASEAAKGKERIGSTLKGIGPTYMDKTGRNGLRIGDIERKDFEARYRKLKEKHLGILSHYEGSFPFEEQEQEWFESIERLRNARFADTEYLFADFIAKGGHILAEGAQGTMLDIDFGTYPFVTSSSTVSAGACIGLGIAPRHMGRVYGIFKAYCTRVGAGPFPTEQDNSIGETLRNAGHEFGATTGRPRRCGWTDLVALRYAVLVNGVTDLIMTKADVLSGFKELKVAVAYRVDGVETQTLPFSMEGVQIEPVYKTLPGWREDITRVKQYSALPQALRDYVDFVEQQVGARISIISVGPDRAQTIIR